MEEGIFDYGQVDQAQGGVIVKIIMKQGIRIFRPSELDSLIDGVVNICTKRSCEYMWFEILNALLYTGMRYVELQRFAGHKEWFDKTTMSIYLPKEASRKKKRTMPDRYVYLSSQGVVIVDNFLRRVKKVPQLRSANWILKKASEKTIGSKGVSVKSFRKTWESWLVVSYPNSIPLISMSQGHTELVSLKHYLNIPFSKEDIKEIKVRTAGWGGFRSV